MPLKGVLLYVGDSIPLVKVHTMGGILDGIGECGSHFKLHNWPIAIFSYFKYY